MGGAFIIFIMHQHYSLIFEETNKLIKFNNTINYNNKGTGSILFWHRFLTSLSTTTFIIYMKFRIVSI
ncbi:hypothetical protein RIR_jg7693.t1 [Rhizophagus irregularis DAOM 181602=DAOM 197198]|uniref:Uncharacterized protein n=1 Tax=Rhizophagus irregularis (strain DAOM 181602 / DAOM 197198 / MUCL 43194) TaxID=747089 RepID=U9UHT9_RHIID|nr:hypothetical protein RIR_jg7693.t1 [Rhizophagus irregularis DAOM 181602=DAOM 197198]